LKKRTKKLLFSACPLLVGLMSGCTIYHVRAYAPGSSSAPPTADAASASTNCFEASTQAEHLACASASLGALYRGLTETFQARIRDSNFAGRDALFAVQRHFLLSLPGICHLPAQAEACLAGQFRAQNDALARWQSAAAPVPAMAQYVHVKVAPGAGAMNPDFCGALARDANVALARAGTLDPAFMPGAQEIAGSHGQPQGETGGETGGEAIGVQLRLANAFGGFAQRAEGVSVGGAPVLDSVSLGNLLQSMAENQGGRFSAYASQTGDYGSADVFSYQGRTVALLADAWGYDTPAAPGAFAHAGAWDVATHPAAPLCLFETFQMPAEGDTHALAALAAWRETLARVRDSAAPPLGVSFLRDQGQITSETDWTLLHMPLVATAQARAGDWTSWLRLRHDAVLDALFAWSQADPANKPVFDRLFAEMRPAARDLVRFYQQAQALDGAEAKQAAGLAVMELTYGATVNIAPTIGADLQAPGSAAGRTPRYSILAAPQ
jgi:hypothetical protein